MVISIPCVYMHTWFQCAMLLIGIHDAIYHDASFIHSDVLTREF